MPASSTGASTTSGASCIPNGESYIQVAARVGAWYDTLTRDTVVAAHGGTARALIAHLRIAEPEAATHYTIEHGVVYVYGNGSLGAVCVSARQCAEGRAIPA